jgi:hypothetical protein
MSWKGRAWSSFPHGTRAYTSNGGFWTRTNRGWQWVGGSTFPTPGGDVVRVEEPHEAERCDYCGDNAIGMWGGAFVCRDCEASMAVEAAHKGPKRRDA